MLESYAELADIAESFIAPDSMPKGDPHKPEITNVLF